MVISRFFTFYTPQPMRKSAQNYEKNCTFSSKNDIFWLKKIFFYNLEFKAFPV